MRRYWEQFIPQSLSEFSWSLAHSPSSIVSLISFNIFFFMFSPTVRNVKVKLYKF